MQEAWHYDCSRDQAADTFSHIGLFSGGSIKPDDLTDLTVFKAKN